jgi:cysteine-rich repeat protein
MNCVVPFWTVRFTSQQPRHEEPPMTRLTIVALVTVLACMAATSHATQSQLPGRILHMKWSPTGGRSLSFSTSVDFAIPVPNGPEDPRTVGANLLIRAASGEAAMLSMPAQGWVLYGGSPYWVFNGKWAPSSPVKKAILRPGSLKLKVATAGISLDESAQGAIAVEFTSGTRKYCLQFGDSYGRDTIVDTTGRFIARNAPTPGWCDGCGDGVLSADEGCDDGNHISGDGCSSNCAVEDGPSNCVVTTAKEVREHASEDPNYLTLIAKAAALGFNSATFAEPLKCTEGNGTPAFYLAIFPNLNPQQGPMVFLSRRDNYEGFKTFLVHQAGAHDKYVTALPFTLHIKENTNPDTMEMLDAAGSVVASGPVNESATGQVTASAIAVAALSTSASESARCLGLAHALHDCEYGLMWATSRTTAAVTATLGCGIGLLAKNYPTVLTACGATPLAWFNVFGNPSVNCDALRGPFPCTVSGDNGECFKGRCGFNLLQTSAACVPENPNKTACDPDCNEQCDNGTCRGFKILSVSPDPPLRLVSNETDQCHDSIFAPTPGCFGCVLNYSSIGIDYCGSPTSPVKVCIGDPATSQFCHYVTASTSPMIWTDTSCCTGFGTLEDGPLVAIDSGGSGTNGGSIPYSVTCAGP